MDKRQGCSFKEVNWGISQWPKLEATEAGKLRRARDSGSRKKVAPSKIVFPPPPIVELTPRFAIRDLGKKAVGLEKSVSGDSGASPAALRPELPSPGPVLSSLSPMRLGKEERLWFEDIPRYERCFDDPGRTPSSIGCALDELKEMVAHERRTLATLTERVASREKHAVLLISRLEVEAMVLIRKAERERDRSLKELGLLGEDEGDDGEEEGEGEGEGSGEEEKGEGS